MIPSVFARRFALCAGLLDLFSGIGLVAMPALVLGLAGLRAPAGEALVYLRFVGVFVAALGASYLWALLDPVLRLRSLFQLTLIFRVATGLYIAVAVSQGDLPLLWVLVTVADAVLVLAQLWFLNKMGGPTL